MPRQQSDLQFDQRAESCYAAHREEVVRAGHVDPGPWEELSPDVQRMWSSADPRPLPKERVAVHWLDFYPHHHGPWPRPGQRVHLPTGRTGIVDTANGAKLSVVIDGTYEKEKGTE